MPRNLLALVAILALLTTAFEAGAVGCTAGNPNANVLESTPTSAFTDNGDGTVTHNLTGLMWKQCAQGLPWNGSTCGAAPAAAVAAQAAATAAAADGTLSAGVRTAWIATATAWGAIGAAADTAWGNAATSWTAAGGAGFGAQNGAAFSRLAWQNTNNQAAWVNNWTNGAGTNWGLYVTNSAADLAAKNAAIAATSAYAGMAGATYITGYTWSAALAAAAADTTAGHSDWRLPNKKELESIVENCGDNPAINQTLFPATPVSNFWSGSSYVPGPSNAWLVYFFDGYSYADVKAGSYSVRLVRGGQLFDTFDAQGDSIPAAFSFTAQTGAALSTVTTSNTITVAGMTTVSSISVSGGSYAINGGGYTTASGAVSNNDTVTVKQTSSGSFSTLTAATLTIGGVSGAFNVTTLPLTTNYTAASAAATGNITASFTGGGAGCGYTVSQFIPLTGHAASPPAGSAPAGVSFPHGLFDFTTGGCTAASTITMVITYPQALPSGTVYWKYGPTPGGGANSTPHWYQLPAVIAGNTATFSITDGGLGDDDLTADGTIVDQGGPGGGGAASIPTLSEWALLVLAGLVGLFGMGAMQRRKGAGL